MAMVQSRIIVCGFSLVHMDLIFALNMKIKYNFHTHVRKLSVYYFFLPFPHL